jgi:hypothetical protein
MHIRGIDLQGGRRFFGYHRDPPHKRTQIDIRAHLYGLKATVLPDVWSARPYRSRTGDQGQTGSCGGHGSATGLATASALSTAFFGGVFTLPFFPSPQGIYAVTRSLERLPNIDGSLPLLTDSGIMPSDLGTAVSWFGVRPIGPLAPDGRYSDVIGPSDAGVANVFDEEDFAKLETDGQRIVTGEFRIDENAPNLVDLVRQTLFGAKAPVGVGTYVDSQVMGFGPTSAPVGPGNLNDPNGGGHWITIDGYRRNPNTGLYEFDVHNSWGPDYGDAGSFWGTEVWLRSATDLIAWTVRNV